MKFPVFILLLLLTCLAYPQGINSITGKVVIAGTNTIIANASVFISGTSRGTVSDKDGNFTLAGIPPGSYELIISSIGYTTLVYPFTAAQLPLQLKIELKTKATELEAVTVEPFDEETWEKWGNIFIQSFIGTSFAARQTNIKNYDKIQFRYYRKKQLLVAIADEPLIIENHALGYKIQYQLEEFQWDQKNRTLFFLGYSLFDDMADDRKRVPRRWAENRKKAFYGSMLHFMKSLYENRLREEKFEVHRFKKERNVEKDRVRDIYKTISRGAVYSGGVTVMQYGQKIGKDTADYYEKIMRQPDYLDIIEEPLLTADSLVSTKNTTSKLLYFPNYLHITYKGAKEENNYLLYSRENRRVSYPRSTIFLLHGNPVTIDAIGLYFPPQEVFSTGYWAWSEKVAHLLPFDFVLEEE